MPVRPLAEYAYATLHRKQETGFLKVSLAKWQNPCYNVYVSFGIAAEQLQ